MTGVPVFCFPHAGATSATMRHWPALSGADLDIRPVDRPGRGRLGREPAGRDADAVVARSAEVVAEQVRPGDRWVCLGHSFGSLLAAATAAEVARRTGHAADLVVVSAGPPPAWQPTEDEIAPLDDAALDDHLVGIGDTPRTVLAGPLGAVLRRHFREDQALRCQLAGRRDLRLTTGLLAVAASEDPYVPAGRMADWAPHTRGPFDQLTVHGDHFAVVRDPSEVLAVIRGRVLEGSRA
ncbi:MAG: thioesterase II family protein [Dermatophilaceae bacterium]